VSASGSAIRFDHVWKSFNGTRVLEDVSFEVAQGTTLCILGRSGTGKSVTLKLLIGLLQPDRGSIFLKETNITALSRRELMAARRRVGFLFQSAALFDSLTVGSNVAFPLERHTNKSPGEIRRVVQNKLAQVGLEEDIDKMPVELSGGMRKRAALARALALDPEILLVDEPSSGLDPITTKEIDDLLSRTKDTQKTTLIVVTHNIPSARRIGDRLAVLDRSRIVAYGTTEELQRSENALVREFMRSEEGG
jgi:phospholipid/cholesterol/gamma-HCH transport system ATP-binding protein